MTCCNIYREYNVYVEFFSVSFVPLARGTCCVGYDMKEIEWAKKTSGYRACNKYRLLGPGSTHGGHRPNSHSPGCRKRANASTHLATWGIDRSGADVRSYVCTQQKVLRRYCQSPAQRKPVQLPVIVMIVPPHGSSDRCRTFQHPNSGKYVKARGGVPLTMLQKPIIPSTPDNH